MHILKESTHLIGYGLTLFVYNDEGLVHEVGWCENFLELGHWLARAKRLGKGNTLVSVFRQEDAKVACAFVRVNDLTVRDLSLC